MKDIWVNQLSTVGPLDGVFLAVDSEVKYTREESPFLKMKLMDKTGSIDAVKWSATEHEQQFGRGSCYVHVKGRVTVYQGKYQVNIDRISTPSHEPDPTDFLPRSERDCAEMQRELKSYINTVRHPQVKALLMRLTHDSPVAEKFCQAPAAMHVHHNFLGGLLEHTLSVVQLADKVATHYPSINRDLLIAGAITHDIGKIEEYDWHTCFRANDPGTLIGHIVQGTMLVNKEMDAMGSFDPHWRTLITHMIISHHGKMEFGSPKVPMVREAYVLHVIEDMDAKLQIIDQVLSDTQNIGSSENWTKFNKWLEASYYRGVPGSTSEVQMDGSPQPVSDEFAEAFNLQPALIPDRDIDDPFA